jgi:hypothetical protein
LISWPFPTLFCDVRFFGYYPSGATSRQVNILFSLFLKKLLVDPDKRLCYIPGVMGKLV